MNTIPEDTGTWTFLSNHGHVLLCIAAEPQVLLRDVAVKVGITERAVQRIVSELEAGGYLTRTRVGRRNCYEVHGDRPLRHPVEAHHPIRELLSLIAEGRPAADRAEAEAVAADRKAESARKAVVPRARRAADEA